MGQNLPAGPLAVYLHFPFCLKPCPYCSFFKRPWSRSAHARYLQTLLQEAELWEKRVGKRVEASSLYFGGGTPSLLKGEEILRLCECFDLKQRDRGTEAFYSMRNERMRGNDKQRWSSSGRDKGMYDSEFAGRLDFNQHARNTDCSDGHAGKHDYSDVLLEVQSPFRHRDKRITCSGALNSKVADCDPVTRNALRITSFPEITLEVNPVQITPDFVKGLRTTPVNRLSIGVQSMRDEALGYLGRAHKAASIPERIRLLRDQGYDNISLDLIYALPGMELTDLRRDLDAFLALGPEHISCYLLTLDEDSELARAIAEGKSPSLPDDESCALQYELICQTLRQAGFIHYEISNFARPGFEGRHNLSYWHSSPYLAMGTAASGWLPPKRYSNPASLDEYYRLIDAGELMPGAETLSNEQSEADEIMMGLRLLEGIDLKDFETRHLRPFEWGRERELERLIRLELLEREDGRIRLSERALFISNAVIGELL